MLEWKTLLPDVRGLVVEGATDKSILEAFLDGGQRDGLWSDWRSRLQIRAARHVEDVQKELKRTDLNHLDIWGLIDRDWRSDHEIAALQSQLPKLLVLPRIMIENYFVDPDDLVSLLTVRFTAKAQDTRLKSLLEAHLDTWVKHGALSQTLHEHGAHYFCRNSDGYPAALIDKPVTSVVDIENALNRWYLKLEPQTILQKYTAVLNSRRAEVNPYHHYLDGKLFFRQVVVAQVLNPLFGQQSADQWISDLFIREAPALSPHCPADLVPILHPLVS